MTFYSSVDEPKARNLDKNESQFYEERDDYHVKIFENRKNSKFSKQRKIEKCLQCKDSTSEFIFYVIKNDENKEISYLNKFSKSKNCWKITSIFPSLVTFMECINGLIVCIFNDCTIHVIDAENGIECFPAVHLLSNAIKFSKLDFNTAGLILEDGTTQIIRFNFKSLELLFNEKCFLDFKDPMIYSTKDLETMKYTMIIEDYFYNDIETEKVYFSFHTNSWCSLSYKFDSFFNISNDFKAETLFELEEKANEEMMFFRPIFFRNISANCCVSLQRCKRYKAA